MKPAFLVTCLFSALVGITPALSVANEQAYVTNEKDDDISVIDMSSFEVIKQIPVGQRPRGIIFNHDQTLAYICASDSDTIQILDLKTEQIIGELPSGEDPETIALHPDGKTIYTANEDDALLTVIDIESRIVKTQIDVGVEPEGLAVSPDGKIVIVTSETTNMVHWINAETNENFDNTLVAERPRSAMFSKDSKRLWVSSEIGGELVVIDVATREIIKTFTFEIDGIHKDRVQPVGVELSDDGKYAYVALGPANHVAVIKRDDLTIDEYLLVGRRVWQLGFNKDQSLLLTTNGVSGDVSVIDTNKHKVVKSVKVGRYPWGVAIKDVL
ncbi:MULTISPECIES: PQQ-dependent catabolism-associated beta-propeller protein [Vibrio]|jgi:PQQ-dependent catabolism-associated beta-propeller protein|uniref:PQQ-dependent catabolism-associated beta-propeller protein n=1 Tax=Vibrio TaxID=662 RepID=UPI000BFFD984|nr:PQQ-dependent catabolism-associated beta-propeller protein [Vibrio sp. PID17_43]